MNKTDYDKIQKIAEKQYGKNTTATTNPRARWGWAIKKEKKNGDVIFNEAGLRTYLKFLGTIEYHGKWQVFKPVFGDDKYE